MIDRSAHRIDGFAQFARSFPIFLRPLHDMSIPLDHACMCVSFSPNVWRRQSFSAVNSLRRFDEAAARRRRRPSRGGACHARPRLAACYLPLACVLLPSACCRGLSSFALRCSTVGVMTAGPAQYSGSGTLHIPYMAKVVQQRYTVISMRSAFCVFALDGI